MRSLKIEPSDLKSKRQRRDLFFLLALAVVTIGSVLCFVPRWLLWDDVRPNTVEHDWTFRIGGCELGVLADNKYTYLACGIGYANLRIPLWIFLVCSLLLGCLPVVCSRYRRHENAA